jgi:outer membrane protein W
MRVSLGSAVLAGRARGADLNADSSQWLSTLDALFFFTKRSARIRPFLALGVGAFNLSARSVADVRLLSNTDDRWAVAGVAGGGVSIGAEHLRLVVETKLLATAPSVAIDVAGNTAGLAGKPSGLLTVALAWTL